MLRKASERLSIVLGKQGRACRGSKRVLWEWDWLGEAWKGLKEPSRNKILLKGLEEVWRDEIDLQRFGDTGESGIT